MFLKRMPHVLFIFLLAAFLFTSVFLLNADAQFPFGPMPFLGAGAYQPYMSMPYQPMMPYQPYMQPYMQPYQQPYMQPYQQPYMPYQQQYPYYQQQYPYYQQQYPYYQQQYPYYQQYPYQQAQYVQADHMLTSSYSGGSGTVEKGDTISIVLQSNATTGYQWYLDDDELDEDVVSYSSRQYYAATSAMLGAGGSEQWLFEAEGEGDTTIKLEYRQTGSSIVSQTFTLDVEVTD